MPSTKPHNVNPVARLREKLAANRRRAFLDKHWCLAFFPALFYWTVLVFVVTHWADWQWRFGPVLTLYFSGVTLLVLWAERSAKRALTLLGNSEE